MKKISLVILLIVSATWTFAQCKSTSKKCPAGLAPYTFSEEFNNTSIGEDESAELVTTLFAGQDYRIILCIPSGLGNIEFTLSDIRGNVIFSNKDKNYAASWDFQVNSTEDYFIQLELVNSSPDPTKPLKGCVAVLVGFKI